jgi:hypothetical protein
VLARTTQRELPAEAGGQPVDGTDQAAGEQPDVEAEFAAAQVELLLLGGEQVHQQGAEAGPLQVLGDAPVARTVAAAAAAVREQHDPVAVRGSRQVAVERHPADGDPDGLLRRRLPLNPGPRRAAAPIVACHWRPPRSFQVCPRTSRRYRPPSLPAGRSARRPWWPEHATLV